MDETILRAVYFYNCKWPKDLFTGIMFFEGKRITIDEFNKIARKFK